MSRIIQPFPDLEPDVEAALRASIQRFGVIIPIVKDQNGRILDGNQRARIAADLGVIPDEIIVEVADDDEAREYARTLNADRRHLTPDQRREVVGVLRCQGHSFRAIAGAVGVSEPTVRRDVDKAIASGDAIQPERVTRQGGGTYPAQRPTRLSAPAKNQRDWEKLHRSGDARRQVQDVRDAAKRVEAHFRRVPSFLINHPQLARAAQLDAFLDAARTLATPTPEELQRELASAERLCAVAEASEAPVAAYGGRTQEAERARRRVERARLAIEARTVALTADDEPVVEGSRP